MDVREFEKDEGRAFAKAVRETEQTQGVVFGCWYGYNDD